MGEYRTSIEDPREAALKSVFETHGKRYSEAQVSIVVNRTRMLLEEVFMDCCSKLGNMAEFPRTNLIHFFNNHRLLVSFDSVESCNKCQITKGLNYYCDPFSDNTADKIGYVTRCSCPAGDKFDWMELKYNKRKEPNPELSGGKLVIDGYDFFRLSENEKAKRRAKDTKLYGNADSKELVGDLSDKFKLK